MDGWSGGEPISLYAAFNEQDEANYIADSITSWVQEGNLRSESAILYRSNAQSRVLEEALVRQGIPYRVYGGLRFYDRQEIRNALAYLRLVHYRRDDAAFERVVNIPTRGIGAKSLAELREYATEQGFPCGNPPSACWRRATSRAGRRPACSRLWGSSGR